MCRGTDGAARLQDLHADVVLNLLQPSLWVYRPEERKTLELLGLPKKGSSHPSASASRSQTPAGTAEPCLRLLLPARLVQGMSHLRYRRLPSNISAALRSRVTHQQSCFAQKP